MHFGFKLPVTSIVNKLSRLNTKDLCNQTDIIFPAKNEYKGHKTIIKNKKILYINPYLCVGAGATDNVMSH